MREKESLSPQARDFRFKQLILCAGFVFGCASRSFVPRADVQRIVLLDSWLSSVAIGRSVATVAELCFMAQAALLLRDAAGSAGLAVSVLISRLVVPFIAVAEVCSWYATLTTNYIGNACEESIWVLCGALLFIGALPLWRRSGARLKKFLAVPFVFAPCYLAFMCLVDVPMYVTRWRADLAQGRVYFTLADGVHDVMHRWVVTRSLEDWRTEFPWMTLYFSVAVWVSLAMTRAPREES